MKKILSVILLACLVIVAGCKGNKKVTTEPAPSENPALSDIDNSEYELQNKQLIVNGLGDSRKQQMAREKSRTHALDTVVLILKESLSPIAEMRGFTSPATDNLDFRDTKTINEKTTAYNSDDGVRIYRSRQTLSVELEPLLKKLYEQIDKKESYGWYAFLRDIDQQLNKRNTTKK